MAKIFIPSFLLISFLTFGQTKSQLPNKTLKDSVFHKGDIIKIPELVYSLSYSMNQNVNDSLIPVADFLKKYPNLKIEIDSHTDSRGKNQSNIALSKFRAQHICNYLIKEKGIDSTRLTYKGYGETLLIISNKEILIAKTNEEKEKLHNINRRTELKVLEVK